MVKCSKKNPFEFGAFEVDSNFDRLREAPPCGAKVGISCLGFGAEC
jgi:hypothetical protein